MEKNSAEAVVIGAGIVGSSITHYLSEKGVGVTLLDKGSIAGGATGKATAVIRMHYTNPWDSAMAKLGGDVYSNWGELIGGESGFVNSGFVFIVGEGEEEKLRANVDILRQEAGINTYALDPESLQELLPEWYVGDVGAAAYEPDSGYGDPHSAATGFARRAQELGAEVSQGEEVLKIVEEGGRVTGVETSKRTISTETVVLAGGAWSKGLGAGVGLDLPINCMMLSIGVLKRPPVLHGSHPACIDAANGIYFRPEPGELTLLGFSSVVDRHESPENLDPDNYAAEPDMRWSLRTSRRIASRIPAMEDAAWVRSWSGVDGNTPDGHLILDKAPGIDGLYLAVGMSGTGFKVGPAVGKCMSELIVDGKASSVDIRPFRLARFEEGEVLVGKHEYNYYLFKQDE